jgi:hypothetical protein
MVNRPETSPFAYRFSACRVQLFESRDGSIGTARDCSLPLLSVQIEPAALVISNVYRVTCSTYLFRVGFLLKPGIAGLLRLSHRGAPSCWIAQVLNFAAKFHTLKLPIIHTFSWTASINQNSVSWLNFLWVALKAKGCAGFVLYYAYISWIGIACIFSCSTTSISKLPQGGVHSRESETW